MSSPSAFPSLSRQPDIVGGAEREQRSHSEYVVVERNDPKNKTEQAADSRP
ncbi:hypothetical protein [Bosea sp. 2RAB26]|uniref:hypothetical protein n=1 Tax=Bosea sp. 2RAB26 TaxID=3237476 RepID=UPI003F90F159